MVLSHVKFQDDVPPYSPNVILDIMCWICENDEIISGKWKCIHGHYNGMGY